MIACPGSVDPDALAEALRTQDAARLLALGFWRCSACLRSDAIDLTRQAADAWRRQARDALVDHIATRERAHAARSRYRARNTRLAEEADARTRAARSAADASKSAVAAALARARAPKPPRPPTTD